MRAGTGTIEGIRREFGCIVGYESVKEELIQICDTMINRDMYQALGADIPRGLLLEGAPGVGKTTMAECIARACMRPVFRLRRQACDGMFIDCMKETFSQAADAEPSLIILDDLDKYADDDMQSILFEIGDRQSTNTEYVVLQSCIDDIADKDIFIVATTNDMDRLPASLVRCGRFDRIRTVYPPSIHDSELILKRYLEDKRLASDVDYRRLAVIASGSSCAYIETIANDAGVIAGYERSPDITMDHIARAYLRWHSGKGREKLSSEERRRVAYHEAGHVVVMEHLMHGVVDMVSAQRNRKPKKEHYMDGLHLGAFDDRNRIAALKALGGRAAIELVYGEPDDLSEEDVASAYLYTDIRIRDGNNEYMHLMQMMPYEGSSEEVLREVEDAVGRELEALYAEALRIVSAERTFLDRLADALCRKDYLLSEEIQELHHCTRRSGRR